VSESIYVMQPSGDPVPVRLTEYPFESDIQGLLERYPELLPGAQIEPDAPLRWLLIKREAGVPAEEGAGGWWALDHLFVDQAGVPTLVEIKRSTDTRVRREVVAQMLEYAANGTAYWDVAELRTWFEETASMGQGDTGSILAGHLRDTGLNEEQFWDRVRDNLKAGRIRCIFLADAIPATLRRLVEFLNEHLDTVEVLAVELPQYASDDGRLKALVPRLVGQTERARAAKTAPPRVSRQWDEESFTEIARTSLLPIDVSVYLTILEWCKTHAAVKWGRGAGYPGFRPVMTNAIGKYVPFSVWLELSTGRASVEIDFEYLKKHSPFSDNDRRRELLERLNRVGLNIPVHRMDGRPSVAFESLRNEPVLGGFLHVMEWVADIVWRDAPVGDALPVNPAE
jgi:hypothetical protein